MEEHSHVDIATIEERNWWYATRRRLLGTLLRRFTTAREIALDVGCGVGSNYPILKAYAQRVIGLDISQNALDNVRAPYDEKVLASVESMPLTNGSVDMVLCADVLEHVDDVRSLTEMFRVLRPGGRAFITVPAYEYLWNENDDYGHHLRRYTKRLLHERALEAGFSIHYLDHWNRLFFLPVWLVALFYTRGQKKENLRNNLRLIPTWFNGILILWMRLENAIARLVPLPFGVSLILVAEKPRV